MSPRQAGKREPCSPSDAAVRMSGLRAIAYAVVPRYVAGTRGRRVTWGVASDAETELMTFLGGAKGKKVTLVVGGVVITGEVNSSDPPPLPGGHVTLAHASLDGSQADGLLTIRLERIDAWVWNGPRPSASEEKGRKAKEAGEKIGRGLRALQEVAKNVTPARRRR